MSIFHIHKFKKAKEKWAIGHEVTTGKTNPYHDGLKDNCLSFTDADSGQIITFDDFFRYIAQQQSKDVIGLVTAIRAKAIENYKRELLFEKVRSETFTQLPSRLKCLYASDSLESISGWLKYVHDNSRCHPSAQVSYEIVELSPLTNTKIFRTQDAAVWECEKLSGIELIDRAASYWNASCGGREELLLEGRFRVIDVI
ncbi:hypothetical protein D3C80_894060 [compost metagenome]